MIGAGGDPTYLCIDGSDQGGDETGIGMFGLPVDEDSGHYC